MEKVKVIRTDRSTCLMEIQAEHGDTITVVNPNNETDWYVVNKNDIKKRFTGGCQINLRKLYISELIQHD
jgi:hypothetical protein